MTNILLICTDQQRSDSLGCYGNPVASTPVLDGLAAKGVLFERCYTPSPVCAPARASMLTGEFPQTHGLWANGVALPPGHPLLGRLLADAGYDCGLAGKFHLSAAVGGRPERRFDDGFRTFEQSMGPGLPSEDNPYDRWLQTSFPALWREHSARPPAPNDVWSPVPGPFWDLPTEAHYSHWVAEETLRFLRQPRHGPFFFVANFTDPHPPFAAPMEYVDRFRDVEFPTPIGGRGPVRTPGGDMSYSAAELRHITAAYYAMVSLIDNEMGRILRAVDDNTLVVFTTDHGEMLGDHGRLLKGPLFYEGAVRVPLILSWPGRLGAGLRRGELVQTLDVFATCLAAAGLSRPSQSIDLLDAEAPGRGWAMCAYRETVDATMVRDDRYKIVLSAGSDGELYDLADDPDELNNLWHHTGSTKVRLHMTQLATDVLVACENRSAPREGPW